MPRPPIKKTRVLAKAAEEGKLKAQTEHEFKSIKWLASIIPFLPEKYKKNAVLWMKNIFERNMDKIPKMVAMIGLTLIIKRLIDTSEELRGRLDLLRLPFERIGPQNPFTKIFPQPFTIYLTDERRKKYEGFFPDWMDWLISFTLAYIIIEHGGQIALGLGKAVSSLGGIVGFLLG